MFKIFNKKNKGSLTVEATLVLPLVIITLLFVTNLLNIYMVHTCMQQSLNNTAKKISQDSYLVYRFAGKNNYENFINKINNVNEEFKEFDNKATETKNNFSTFQGSIKETVTSLTNITHTFDNAKTVDENGKEKYDIIQIFKDLVPLRNNINDLIDKTNNSIDDGKKVAKSIDELKSTGTKNIKSIAIKLLSDTAGGFVTTSISTYLFNNYINDLGVPASRISEFNFFHSSLNADGSFTMVATYRYNNPFSFINDKSMEYSAINKTIRMTNAITIKPFVGKNGTSLIKEEESSETAEQEEQRWYITMTGTKLHCKQNCGNSTFVGQVTYSQAMQTSAIDKNTPFCSVCCNPDGTQKN